MKTKIFISFLFATMFCFAQQVSAQQVIKFTDQYKNYEGTEIRANIYCEQDVTLNIFLHADIYESPYQTSATFKVGFQSYTLNHNNRSGQQVEVKLHKGYNSFAININWYRRLGRRDISIFGKWKRDFIWEQTQLNFIDAFRAMKIVMNIYQH